MLCCNTRRKYENMKKSISLFCSTPRGSFGPPEGFPANGFSPHHNARPLSHRTSCVARSEAALCGNERREFREILRLFLRHTLVRGHDFAGRG